MKFALQLSADYPDPSYGGARIYADMLAQAALADQLGFEAVTVTEHHLMNILMMPAPLMFAVKIAAHTTSIKIITSIVVLPLHDMRTFAGEVVVADIFTEGRLLLGVGRGAFKVEMARLGVPMEETRARFEESLEVLQALLTEEDVSWDGTYYRFDPLTIMPRPVRPGGPPMMMAVLHPEGIYRSTKRGFHIQTTPLSGNATMLREQVGAFTRAKDEMGAAGQDLTLSVSRVGFMARSKADHQAKLSAAEQYFSRFDNVFTGPGLLDRGQVRPLPRRQTREELDANLLICDPPEMIDALCHYAELGVDRVILNMNFGATQPEVLESIQCFAEEVMPHVSASTRHVAAE